MSTPQTGETAKSADTAARDPSPDPLAAGVAPDLASLRAENEDLKDRLLRALAETENVRRRAARDMDDLRQYAVAKFAGDVLSVADNIERALASVSPQGLHRDGSLRKLYEGIELTERELQSCLMRHGVRKLNPEGEKFDPNMHEALFELPDSSVPEGTVGKVVEAGYAIGSRPLRPAKVGVTKGGERTHSDPT